MDLDGPHIIPQGNIKCFFISALLESCQPYPAIKSVGIGIFPPPSHLSMQRVGYSIVEEGKRGNSCGKAMGELAISVATCCHIRLGYELLVHNIYKFDLYTVN
jgi:hypothetical protein